MARRFVAMGLLAASCVGAPEASRDGGTPCQTEAQCNGGATCGALRRCVAGYCTDDTTLRACPDGRYGDASTSVGQCLTWVDCNRAQCGLLIQCVAQRCDTAAPPLSVPCGDGG